MQVRLATPTTSDDYVAGKLWRLATLTHCPWHPAGGCGFCRHGTYERVRPPGALIARWYCRQVRRTVSALPDCLASHYSGTLADLEATVLAVEQAPSRAAAAGQLRTEIELPGALRYLDRLCRAIHGMLAAIRGLLPERFEAVAPTLQAFAAVLGTGSVLIHLRGQLTRYLPQLPIPFGFDPHRRSPGAAIRRRQHPTGPDPPTAILEAAPAGRCPAG
ncbi:MAG: hypothetical protein WBO37_09420 [Gammaproteobacteria bacterium]